MNIYLIVLFIYLGLLIAVSIYKSFGVKTQTDFMVAGRGLGLWLLVGTMVATWMGSGSIIAGAGLGYRKGFSALWMSVGAWVAMFVLYAIAGKVRKLAQFTVPDILELRYNSTARVLGTIVTIVAYTAIVSYQFKAGGLVLNIVTGLPVEIGIIITMVFVILYTVLAGLISVAYTDIINGTIMIIGFIICIPFIISHGGGLAELSNKLPAYKMQVLGNMSLFEALSYALPTMLLLLGESNMYQRFFAAKNSKTAKRSVIGWVIGTVIAQILIIAIAVIGSAVFLDIHSEQIMIYAARYAMPAFIGSILLAALIAVIVSTADSFLLVPSTNIMRDIYQRFINPEVSQRRILLFSRLTVIVLGLFAYFQLQFFPTVLKMALYAYTMYGVGITPALLACFFWRRTTAAGGASSILGGMVMTIIWEAAGQPLGVATIYPALITSLFLLIFVSLVTKPNVEKINAFYEAAN